MEILFAIYVLFGIGIIAWLCFEWGELWLETPRRYRRMNHRSLIKIKLQKTKEEISLLDLIIVIIYLPSVIISAIIITFAAGVKFLRSKKLFKKRRSL